MSFKTLQQRDGPPFVRGGEAARGGDPGAEEGLPGESVRAHGTHAEASLNYGATIISRNPTDGGIQRGGTSTNLPHPAFDFPLQGIQLLFIPKAFSPSLCISNRVSISPRKPLLFFPVLYARSAQRSLGLRDRLQRRRKRIRIVDPPPPPPWLLLSLLQHPPNFQERRQQVRSARKAALGGERGGSDRSWGHGGKRGRSRLGGGKREGYPHPAIFLSRATVFSARFLSRSRRYGKRRRGAQTDILRRR